MLSLPTQWHASHGLFYGVAHANGAYTAYITDFCHAWVEDCPENGVSERARAAGIDNVSRDQLLLLVDSLAAAFAPSEGIVGSLEVPETVSVTVELEGGVKWAFCLSRMASCEELLAHINYQQFANRGFWAHRVALLELLLAAKDRYNDYLLQNFKDFSHDLAAKYKRTHRGATDAMEKYERSEWEARIKESYADKLAKSRFSRKNTYQRKWALIEGSIRLPAEWAYANLFQETTSENASQTYIPLEDVIRLPIKLESGKKRSFLFLSLSPTKAGNACKREAPSEMGSLDAKNLSSTNALKIETSDPFEPLTFSQPDLSPTKRGPSFSSSQLLPRKRKRLGVYKHRKS